MAQKLLHKRKYNGAGAPTSSKIEKGEIAINGFAGEERLYIKNSNNDIKSFMPDDLLSIGSENLLDNSESEKTRGDEYVQICNPLNIFDEYGTGYYTVSFDAKSKIAGDFRIYWNPGETEMFKYYFNEGKLSIGTSWKRYSYTMNVGINNPSATNSSISLYGNYGTGKVITVRNVKLSRGNKCDTKWVPSYNDLKEKIDSKPSKTGTGASGTWGINVYWANVLNTLTRNNEFNFIPNGYKGDVWINYGPKTDGNSNVTSYLFGVGGFKESYAYLKGNGFIKAGSSSNYALLGDGGHIALSKWGGIATIGGDGVMEIGKYVDFHNDESANRKDYSTRVVVGDDYGNQVYLPSTSGTLALTNGTYSDMTVGNSSKLNGLTDDNFARNLINVNNFDIDSYSRNGLMGGKLYKGTGTFPSPDNGEDYGPFLFCGSEKYAFELSLRNVNKFYFRAVNGDTWSGWNELWHSGNLTPSNYALKSGCVFGADTYGQFPIVSDTTNPYYNIFEIRMKGAAKSRFYNTTAQDGNEYPGTNIADVTSGSILSIKQDTGKLYFNHNEVWDKGNFNPNNYVSKTTFTKSMNLSIHPGKWLRIAETVSDSVADTYGTLKLDLYNPGSPVYMEFDLGIQYTSDPYIIQKAYTSWSGQAFSKARIVFKSPYGGQKAFFELYVADNKGSIDFSNTFVGKGWKLVEPFEVSADAYPEKTNTHYEISLSCGSFSAKEMKLGDNGWFGSDSSGVFMSTKDNSNYINLKDGALKLNNSSTFWHSGNLNPGNYLPKAGGYMSGKSGIYWDSNIQAWNEADGFTCINALKDGEDYGYYAGISYKGYYGIQLRNYGGNTDLFQLRGNNHSVWGTWRNIWHDGNLTPSNYQEKSSSLYFEDNGSYVGASFHNSALSKVAAQKYIEWWDGVEGAGWMNHHMGKIYSHGTISASSGFFDDSDERLKNFIGDIEVDFNKIKSIPKKYFVWKDGKDRDKMIHIGTSAQEVQKVYPELVSENEDGMLSVDYSKLSIIALKAVDELHEENNLLKKKNQELEDRLRAIEEKLGL